MTIKIAGVEFDSHVYDAEVDVLYLHVGEPASAVDWGTPRRATVFATERAASSSASQSSTRSAGSTGTARS